MNADEVTVNDVILVRSKYGWVPAVVVSVIPVPSVVVESCAEAYDALLVSRETFALENCSKADATEQLKYWKNYALQLQSLNASKRAKT